MGYPLFRMFREGGEKSDAPPLLLLIAVAAVLEVVQQLVVAVSRPFI